jgi:hypothetical protein
MDVLGEQAQLQAAGAHDFAAIRRLLIRDHPENCRFSGAVATDQSDMLTRIDLKRSPA